MNIADDYIRSVIHCLPPAGPMRARIEMELRVIVAEQLELALIHLRTPLVDLRLHPVRGIEHRHVRS